MEATLEQFKDLNILVKMIKNVFIAGQKPIAESLFKLCLKHDLNVVKCCAPGGDKHLRAIANFHGVDIIKPGQLAPEELNNIDIGFCAHYFGYISSQVRSATRLGWLGYHPSLLPFYKGKNSVVEAVESRDKVIGGSLYWLNESLDGGDIAYQDFRLVYQSAYRDELAAKRIWVEALAPLGLALFERAIIDLKRGALVKRPQREPLT